MRKLILSALMVASGATVFAQSLDDVQEKLNKGKFDEAKEKIDKILASSKGQKEANSWYYKGIVYTNLAADTTKGQNNFRDEAFEAFKKYYDMDKKNTMGTLEQNARLAMLYEGYYNDAIRAYNTKNLPVSFQNFRKALEIEEYMNAKQLTSNGFPPALDTNLVLNVAATAFQAKMEDSAIAYYQRLADARLKDDKYLEIYQTLVDYYGRKNDATNKEKYLALAKELYPGNDFWFEVELTPLRENKPQLFAKYQELIQKNPSSYYLTYNYAVELFNYVYANESKPADAKTYEPLMDGAIEAAIKANPTADAYLLMVRYLSDKIYKQEDAMYAIKGTKPEDVKKKQAMQAQVTKLWDQMAPYAEAGFNTYVNKTELSGRDKGNLKLLSNVLVDYYNMKKQSDKAKSFQEKAKQLGV